MLPFFSRAFGYTIFEVIVITNSSERFFIIICAALALTLGAILVLSPPKSFSEKENRALAGAPSFRVKSFTSGEFLTELSNFCADQFPFREYLTDVKAKCEILLGKRENNGVFITKSTLVDLCEYKDPDVLEQNLAAMRRFSTSTRNKVTLLCAPRAVDISAISLGIDNTFSQGKLYSKINECGIDTLPILSPLIHEQNISDNIWYRTDHHWTTRGAHIAYKLLMIEWGITPYGEEFFDKEAASHGFLGSAYSRSGVTDYTPDSIYLYRYDGDGELEVEYVSERRIKRGFYDLDKLGTRDKYAVFLGGNFDHIKIRTDGDSRPRLLLIKDSFANSVIPFLALHFDIDVIDPRYINEPISTIVDLDGYDRILILCGADTLATDTGFGKQLGK